MMKNQTTLTNMNRCDQFKRIALASVALFMFMAYFIAPNVVMAAALDGLMNTVVDIVTTAARYIGIVIIIWGVFQIILAFRREDSEGISKQITTVVVGGVLVGFDVIAGGLIGSL